MGEMNAIGVREFEDYLLGLPLREKEEDFFPDENDNVVMYDFIERLHDRMSEVTSANILPEGVAEYAVAVLRDLGFDNGCARKYLDRFSKTLGFPIESRFIGRVESLTSN
jgi:hypothetical protein